MNRLLLLSPQGNRLLQDNEGRSILRDLDPSLHILTDRASVGFHRTLEHGTVQGLRLTDFNSAQALHDAVAAEHARQPFTAVGLIDEASMEVAAALRQRLGIVGLTPEMAKRFRDKTEMKRLLHRDGVRVPAFLHTVEPDGVARLLERHGRVVIKERKGFGSRGVTFIDSLAGLETWLRAERHPEDFEVEEFISGPLYNVNAIVLGGRLAFVATIYNRPGMADVDFSTGAPFVSHILQPGRLHDRFAAYAAQVRDTLELEDGVMHLECFLTPASEIVFCEVAARPGGGGVMRLIEQQFGLNMARVSLQIELGLRDQVLAPIARRNSIACFIGFRNNATGFIRAMPEPSELDRDWVDRIVLRKATGEFAAPAAHCTDFVAHVDFHADDPDDFAARADELNAAFAHRFSLAS